MSPCITGAGHAREPDVDAPSGARSSMTSHNNSSDLPGRLNAAEAERENDSVAPSLRESPNPRPIQVPVWRYICPFCRRGRSTAKAASAHIARCFKNPGARSCKTCHAYEPAERGDYATGYPGCPEGCHAGRDLTNGLPVGCPDWEPRPVSSRKDGSSKESSNHTEVKS